MGKYCWRRLITMVTPQDWKKSDDGLEVLKNYRTISKLPFIGNVIKWIEAQCSQNSPSGHPWFDAIQSHHASIWPLIDFLLDFSSSLDRCKWNLLFSKGFCWNPSCIILRIWLIGLTVLIKSEILIATGMVWPVSSDKRKALSVNRNILYFHPHHNS